MREPRWLIWDFDGTLAYRNGQWSGAVHEVLQRHGLAPHVTMDDLRPHLGAGFRWHNAPTRNRPEISANDWWAELDQVFIGTLQHGAGLAPSLARELAGEVRSAYLDHAKWALYPDTLPTLASLSEKGWRHILLTNHVPELASILAALRLDACFELVFNSATTGVEKPHPGAFENVRARLQEPFRAWMIGDNISADIQGAEAAGIPAILVRKPHPGARRFAESLPEIESFLD